MGQVLRPAKGPAESRLGCITSTRGDYERYQPSAQEYGPTQLALRPEFVT